MVSAFSLVGQTFPHLPPGELKDSTMFNTETTTNAAVRPDLPFPASD